MSWMEEKQNWDRIKAAFGKVRACCRHRSCLKNASKQDLSRWSLGQPMWGFPWPRGMLIPQRSRAGGPSSWGSSPRAGWSLPSLPPLFPSSHPKHILSFGKTKQILTEQKKPPKRLWRKTLGRVTLGPSPGTGDASEIKRGVQDLRGTSDKLGRSRWEAPGHTQSMLPFWFGTAPGFNPRYMTVIQMIQIT